MKRIWIDENDCTGCGVCSNICPSKAIKMESDVYGFIYPKIGNSCVDCGLCEKICRKRNNLFGDRFKEPKTYAAWSKNEVVRFSSTSGGVFSELVIPILARGGYIVGAQYDMSNLVEHTMICAMEDIEKIRQSKYIQSNPRDIYTRVKNEIIRGHEVVFCGAPCQVAGLYAFLGGEQKELTTIDFICRGVNSPKAYLSWLNELENQQGTNVSRVWFKYKDGGWNSSPKRTRIDFENGTFVIKEGEDNLFMHGYLTSNLYIRPSCGKCIFKGTPRYSDISLADFWGIDKSLDDDKGTSLVLINSKRGEALFEESKNSLIIHERMFSEIQRGNVCFTDSVTVPKRGKRFLKDLDKMPFSSAIKNYTDDSLFFRIKRKIGDIIDNL